MTTSIVFYFQVHQPQRLRPYSYFDIGHNHFYYDDDKNRSILKKVAEKCYLPTNALLLKLIREHAGQFRIAFSISGIFLEQCQQFAPEIIESFQDLVETGCVELLDETYYHSLSSIFSLAEFKRQVQQHRSLMESLFNYTPTTFRNTELIYANHLAPMIADLGYDTILAEGADKVLGWRSPDFVYHAAGLPKIHLLLKNYRLSDDIAFRFSNAAWSEFPLYADKFARWVHAVAGNAEVVNLFMDYETFGEHQWEDKGIFKFLERMPTYLLMHPDFDFALPSEAVKRYSAKGAIDFPEYVSWADTERDLSAWYGNDLQNDALESLYAIEDKVYASEDPNLIRVWQSLQTSDHFYYMCTKYFADGDVHKYFNPYSSPYDAYVLFQNVLADFRLTVESATQENPVQSVPQMQHV